VQTKLHTKSQLEVTDLSCKATTVVGVDGTRVLKSTKDEEGNIVNDSMILTGMEYTVRLSQAYSPFKYVDFQSPILPFNACRNRLTRGTESPGDQLS
jgi:hypothetical protein